jgi:hypothetical protein
VALYDAFSARPLMTAGYSSLVNYSIEFLITVRGSP